MALESLFEKIDQLSYSLEKLTESLPDHIYSPKEVILSAVLLKWHFAQDDLEYSIFSVSEVFEFGSDLHGFSSYVVEAIDLDIIENISIESINLTDPVLDSWFQNLLSFDNRKSLASNYTEHGSKIIPLIEQYDNLLDRSNPTSLQSICDPYCGSGNLITGYLYWVSDIKLPAPKLIHINDLMPAAVLLAYTRIVASGFSGPIIASIGDGFLVTGEFDVLLINPPYTRSHRISDATKEALQPYQKIVDQLQTKHPNKNLRVGHAGLHFWALLQTSTLLNNAGRALVVLPRAILNAVYSQVIKYHLLSHYEGFVISEYSGKKAFSEGSGLKEILLYLRKNLSNSSDSKLAAYFGSIDPGEFTLEVISNPNKDDLMERWNWGIFLLNQTGIELEHVMASTVSLTTAEGLDFDISRGIELYGPDIFFFPSRQFDMIQDNASITLIHKKTDEQFSFDLERFRIILRQPKLYTTRISPEIEHVVILLDDEINKVEESFVSLIKPMASSARRNFGEDWYQHPAHQVNTKDPVGHLFIIDKLDLTSTPTLAYYTETPTLCTKNFYVLKSGKLDPKEMKFLAAWMNSSLYFLLYLLHRREIGGTYGRMQIIDYDHHSLFPSLDNLSPIEGKEEKRKKVFQEFDTIRTQDLPSLVDQITDNHKRKLDTALLSYFDISFGVEELYGVISKILQSRVV